MAEERISELTYKSRELIQSGRQEEKTEGNESLRALGDNIECINTCKMGTSGREEKEKGSRKNI